MKKSISLFFVVFVCLTDGFSQTTFQKSFDFCGDAIGVAAYETEAGYLILSSLSDAGCISLLLLDSLGNIKDSNELSFLPELRINAWDDAIVQDDDGNLIIFGQVIDSTFWDPYFIKISTKTLDIIWTARVRTDDYLEKPLAIKRYKGNYLALSEMNVPLWTSDTSLYWYEAKMFFIEIDSEGQILNEVIIEDSFMYSYPGNFVVLDNGGIAVVHDSSDDSFFFHDGYLSFIDSNFNVINTSQIEEIQSRSRPTIQVSKNKNRLYVSCRSHEYFPDTRWQNNAKIYCYDLNGDIVWRQEFFTGVEFEVHYGDIAQNNDIIVCGRDRKSDLTNYHEHGRLARVDQFGNTKWDRLYKIPNHSINFSQLFYAIETKDKGILAVGYMKNPDSIRSFQPDIYVLKLDSNGCLKPSCDSIILPFPYITPQISDVSEKYYSENINLYPNPTFGTITISSQDYSLQSFSFKLYNALGQLVLFEKSLDENASLDISNFSEGIYHYVISSKGTILKSGVLSKID